MVSSTLKLQFFNHPEGYIEPVSSTPGTVNGSSGGQTTYSSYSYIFQYKDHLGNIRLSYSDNDLDGAINPTDEIIEESNYYPFGLKQKGYNIDITGGNDLAQQWKFGGKQYDESLDLNTYDFGARNYDPALGRWMNIDPLAEMMRRHSPYNYAFNNPIFFIDPDGMASIPSLESGAIGGGGRLTGQGISFNEVSSDNIQANEIGQQIGSTTNSTISTETLENKSKAGQSNNSNTQRGGSNGGGTPDYKKYFKNALEKSQRGDYSLAPLPENNAGGIRKYGGDGSGSISDNAHKVAGFLNQFNPIANLWDTITYTITGKDRYGNDMSLFEASMTSLSIIPLFKGGATALNQIPKTSVSIFRVYGGEALMSGKSYTIFNPKYVPHFRNFAGLPTGNI